MEYKKYIDLGFERIDMNDAVELRSTGYGGFILKKQINDKIDICVNSGELDKPKLYIKKNNSDTYHILQINTEIVKDLLQ
jgi:hypothetical protein